MLFAQKIRLLLCKNLKLTFNCFIIFTLLSRFFTDFSYSSWYSNWKYRKSITNNLAQNEDLTNFPLLIVISNDSDLNTYAGINGLDILFTLNDGTNKINHEIEYYMAGTLIAWVKIPYLSAAIQASNLLYIYFDNTKPGDQQNKTNVWSDYTAVWHFNEGSGATVITDSSPNSINSTGMTGVPSTGVLGKIGAAVDFPQPAEAGGSKSWFSFGNPAAINSCTNNLTLEIWMNQDANNVLQNPWGKAYAGEFAWTCKTNGSITCYYGITGSNSGSGGTHYKWLDTSGTAPHQLDRWEYWASVRDFSNNTWAWYSNGALNYIDLPWTNWCMAGNENFFIGRGYIAATNFCGMLDEARISRIARSSNWLRTAFINLNNPLSFRTIGLSEIFPCVYFSSVSSASTPCAINENTVLALNAYVLSGIIISVNISWGDGLISSYSPGIPDISAENFSHVYTSSSNYTVTAVVFSSGGMAATNSTVISTLPYQLYKPYNMSFLYEPKGCLIRWNIASSENILHCNLYKDNNFYARIENSALREYLDERIIFSDCHSYWMEVCYSAGSIFSATNLSVPHNVYYREAVIGTSGGSVDTLLAGLYASPNALSGTCTISMTILSNRYESFYESGKPVYQQIDLSSPDISGKIKSSLVLKFRIPATNGSLVFKPFEASGYTTGYHKDKLVLTAWDGSTWNRLSTAAYENRCQNNFSFLELETSVNRLGIYGVMNNPQSASDEKVTVKNRLFVPGLANPALSSVQVSFSNPNREQVRVQVFDTNGKIIIEDDFDDWLSYWSWDGTLNSGKLSGAGLYIVSIIIGGKRDKAYVEHVYLLK